MGVTRFRTERKKVKMKISVIMYGNIVEEIEKTILNIKNNSKWEEVEILLMNFDEKDEKIDLLCEKYENILHLPVEDKNKAEAFNIGLKQAKGEYITFIEQGTTYSENALRNLVKYIKNKEANVICLHPYFVVENVKKKYKMSHRTEIVNLEERPNKLNLAFDSYFFNKKVLQDKNFSEDVCLEDAEMKLLLEILDENKIYYNINAEIYYKNAKEDNTSVNFMQYNKDWYTNSLKNFVIPFCENYVNKEKEIPEFIQEALLYYIFAKYNCNLNDRNKMILDADEAREFFTETAKALKYIDNDFILGNFKGSLFKIPRWLAYELIMNKNKDLKPYMEHPVGRSQAEDVGLLYSVLPHVKHLGYIPEAYYYYFQRDNSSSNSDNFVENYCIDDYFYALRELFQMDYGIYNQNAYRHFIQMIYYGLKSPARVYFKAEYIEFLQEVAPYIVGNPKMKCFQDLTQYLCCQTIPAVLYVIDNPLSLPHENVCLESRKHYAPHCKIINLTDSYIENIPVIVQEAMEKKNYKFVHEYLALRHIYSYGGMFIGTNIKLNKPIGELRTYSAFLGYANGDQINSSFWGAVQRHPLVAYVLNTYESDSITNQMDVSLSDRFYFVLCKEYGLLQKNMGQQNLRDNVVVFRCDKLSFKLDDKNVSQIYYEETFLADRKGLLSVPQEILDFIISETVKKREGELKKKNSNSSSETDYYKKEVERLKNSRSWKITRPLRKIFNFFRKVKYSSMEID